MDTDRPGAPPRIGSSTSDDVPKRDEQRRSAEPAVSDRNQATQPDRPALPETPVPGED